MTKIVKLEKVDDKTAYENLLIKYAELEKENADLKRDKEDLIFVRNAKADHIIELKEQIEKMKCCQNCKYDDKDCIEEPCCDCSRILGDIKRKGASDKWEIEENDKRYM